MIEVLLKLLPVFLVLTLSPLILGWLRRGVGNRRIYILGGILMLISLPFLLIDLTRKQYNESDYSIKQITIQKCQVDDLGDGIITSKDNLEYSFDRALLRRIGSAPELAKLLCHQEHLKIWLNPENEMSAFEGQQMSIPLEIGIGKDNARGGGGIVIGGILAGAGIPMLIGAFWNDRRGKKIEL